MPPGGRGGSGRGAKLTTERGDTYALLYEGRPGGLAGPDFRDAVLLRADGVRVYGDVELHLRTDGWTAHGHDQDPRYNGVVLHVVVTPPRTPAGAEVALADGGRAPARRLDTLDAAEVLGARRRTWPCEGMARRLGPRAMRGLLHEAGVHGFMLRAAALAGEVCAALAGEVCAALATEEEKEAVGFALDAGGPGAVNDYRLKAIACPHLARGRASGEVDGSPSSRDWT